MKVFLIVEYDQNNVCRVQKRVYTTRSGAEERVKRLNLDRFNKTELFIIEGKLCGEVPERKKKRQKTVKAVKIVKKTRKRREPLWTSLF